MLVLGLHWTSPDRVAPPMKFSTAQDFFSEIETKIDTEHAPTWNYKVMAEGGARLSVPPAGKVSLPVWNDELYFEYHRGVMTTQAEHKRNMRQSEEQLLNAEKYSSLAWLLGKPYPHHRLNEAWQKALFNQFHDLAAGSGIGILYKDSQRDFDVVRWSTEEATTHALGTISSRVKTSVPAGVPVMVVNPLAWTRTDLATFDVQFPSAPKGGISVQDTLGKPVLFQ